MAAAALTALAVAALLVSIPAHSGRAPVGEVNRIVRVRTERQHRVVDVVSRVRRLVMGRATQRAVGAALPDAVEMLILVVQAGLTPQQAIVVLARRAPAPVRAGFVEVRHRVERGAPLADALQALPDTLGPTAHAVADTLAVAERHGSPIAHTLEQLALDVRERRRRQAEAEARKLPIRLSFPLVVCTLPAFVLVAIVPAVLAALKSLGDNGF
jgi:tight adherence protein C